MGLGDIGSAIFGDDASQSIEQAPIMTPEQQQLLRDLITRLAPIFFQPGTFDMDFLGLGMSPTETYGTGGLENIARAFMEGGGSPLMGTGMQALEGILTRGPADIDEVFTRTVEQPLLEDFGDIMEQAIPARFSGQLTGGEARQAEATAREDLFDTLGRERARFSYEADRANQQDILAGLGLTPSIAGGNIDLFRSLIAGGGAQRRATQSLLDERSRRFGELLGLLSPQAFENIVFNDPGSAGILSEFLSSFSGGMGEGAADWFWE